MIYIENVKIRRSNLLCEIASVLLALVSISIFTYMTVTYINVRKYESKHEIKVAGNSVISLYNIVGKKEIISVTNKRNKDITIIYKNITQDDVEDYINVLLSEKYVQLEEGILSKNLGSSKVLISIYTTPDNIYAINYNAK